MGECDKKGKLWCNLEFVIVWFGFGYVLQGFEQLVDLVKASF